MALSVTDSGVNVRTGRGRNAVEISISFREIDAWAKRMKADEPRLWRLAYGRACSGLKKKLVNVMQHGGGESGVPKFRDFEDFTKELRSVRGTTAKMGGVLADRAHIVASKQNGAQIIGWPDSMEEIAEKFQEGRGGGSSEKWFTDPSYRQTWHRRGIANVPHEYVHNERMVLVPYFADYVRAHLDEWAKGAYYKGLVRLMQRGQKPAQARGR